MVPQGVQGTYNFLDINAMKQTPSCTSELFLSRSKNSPILRDMTGSLGCSLQFADTDLMICIVYSVSNSTIIITINRVQAIFWLVRLLECLSLHLCLSWPIFLLLHGMYS